MMQMKPIIMCDHHYNIFLVDQMAESSTSTSLVNSFANDVSIDKSLSVNKDATINESLTVNKGVAITESLNVGTNEVKNHQVNIKHATTIENTLTIVRNNMTTANETVITVTRPNVSLDQSVDVSVGKSSYSGMHIRYTEPNIGSIALNNSPNIVTFTKDNVDINRKLNLSNPVITSSDIISYDDTMSNVRGIYVRNCDDAAAFRFGSAGSDKGYLEICTGDNGDEPIYVRQYQGSIVGNNISSWFNTKYRTLTLLDASGNTYVPGNLFVGSSNVNIMSEINNLKALL